MSIQKKPFFYVLYYLLIWIILNNFRLPPLKAHLQKQLQALVCNSIDVWEMHVRNPKLINCSGKGEKSVLIADFPMFDLISVEEQKV